MKKDYSVLLSRIALLLFLVILVGIDIFCVPLIGWFYGGHDRHTILLAVTIYALSIPAYFALFFLNRLLKNISGDEVFTRENTNCLRYTCWCLTAGFIVLAAGSFNDLRFVSFAAACGFVALIVHIVKNVFEKALLMKDELDLTV